MSEEIPWGPLGYVTFKRTYARRVNEGKVNSSKEEYIEAIDKRWLPALNKQLKCNFTDKELSEIREMFISLKGSIAGRFMWQLGTKTVDNLGLFSLQNCAAVVVDEPIKPFTWVMDALMLGSGTGYNIQREHVYKLPKLRRKVKIVRKDTKDADFIIPDSREGWIELLRKVLEAHFITGEGFSYSTICLRGKGTLIKGFGGVASGPEELCWGMSEINKILNARSGKQARPIDCLDIMNIIGAIVVAGNVRRSAQIAIGDMDDLQFLNAKNWSEGNIPNWRAMSNNSVVCNDITRLPEQFWNGYQGNGEPYGLINLKLSREVGRLGETQYPDEEVMAYNPCVTGDTEVLTIKGYERIDKLIDKEMEVWNGFEFSKVTPKITGYDQRLLEVSFSNGRTLKCTPYHKFIISKNYNGLTEKIEAKDLKIGDKLIKHNFPILREGKEVPLTDAYTQGFYSGDGVVNRNLIWLYEPKFGLEKFMNVRQTGKEYTNIVGVTRKTLRMNFDFKDKKYVPHELNLQGKLAWFSGLLDSDGTELKEGGSQVCSIDKDFLLEVQKMLTTCGESTKVVLSSKAGFRTMPDQKGGTKKYFCKELYRICISAQSIQNLKKLGLNTKRLKFDKSPNRDASRFVQITGVKELGVEPIVYCFEEPLRNLGCFNGIVTGQCAEQSLANYETCCLAEVHLPNITSEGELKRVVTYLYRINKHSLALKCHQKETEAIVHKNMRMGIGITGYCMSTKKQKSWLKKTYEYIREYDVEYSKKHGFPVSKKITTIKPSGTLSLLSGSTPGGHPGFSFYHIRRIRMSSNIPLVEKCRQSGYKVEYVGKFDGTDDRSTVVVEFPCKFPKHTLVADDCTAIDQLEINKELQSNWSDNSVSCTVYYSKSELPQIKKWLRDNYNDSVKTVSFLLQNDHGFDQAPLEAITKEDYDKMIKNCKPITDVEIEEKDISSDQIGCAGGACPIK